MAGSYEIFIDACLSRGVLIDNGQTIMCDVREVRYIV